MNSKNHDCIIFSIVISNGIISIITSIPLPIAITVTFITITTSTITIIITWPLLQEIRAPVGIHSTACRQVAL